MTAKASTMNLNVLPDDAWEALFPPGRKVIEGPVATVVRPPVQSLPATVIVVGAFRGGTSYVAEQLHECGVPIGERFSTVTPVQNYTSYEDADLAEALDPLIDNLRGNFAEYMPLLTEKIAARDAAFDLWGFKKPAVVFTLDRLLHLFRNPHVIAVVRDPVASHQSAAMHGVIEPGRMSIADCRAHFGAVMEFVDRPRCPTLAVSYERAKGRPGHLRDAIRDFLPKPVRI